MRHLREVRVVAPLSLAREIFEEIQAAGENYMPRLPFDSLRPSTRSARSGQDSLRPGRLEPLKMTMESRTQFFRLKAEATG